MLSENLLNQALKLSGMKTYSAAVDEALREYCRIKEASRIFDYQGSGIWEGNLSDMRSSRSLHGSRKSRNRI